MRGDSNLVSFAEGVSATPDKTHVALTNSIEAG
jgi:hypothetical protein